MSDVASRLNAALEGRYVVERELGEGGMATVYLAEDVKHHRQVALKVLRSDLAASLGAERFLREIEIAAQLTHPHIVPLHDSGEADGFLFYVLPYIEGESLRERLSREGELPVTEVVRILHDVLDALAYAHDRGVLHRDIKPDNVMLSGRHALVTDFGVAKAVSEATGRQKLTTMGVALGTPAYMSPEQAGADENIDHRSDIYAVGAMAYELLAGRPPFTGLSAQAVLTAHVTKTPEPVTEHRGTVPPALARLVMRCLEKKPADRWQTAEEMLPQLEAMATPSGGLTPTGTTPVAGAGPKRKWVVPASILAGAVLVVLAVVRGGILSPQPLTITVSNERQVTSDLVMEFEPALSPDGSKVVFSRGGPFRTHPYVQVLGEGATVRLGEDMPGVQRAPRWDASGDRVIFWTDPLPAERSGRAPSRWMRTSMLGGVSSPVEAPWPTAGHMVAWSRDGTRMVYDSFDVVYVRPVTGGDRTPVAEGLFASQFDFSPDGERVAFVELGRGWLTSDRLGNIEPSAIWVADADGASDPVRVTGGGSLNVSAVWMPDGRHLLFVSNRDGARAIYVVEVGPNGAIGEPRRLPGGANPHTISISHDGGRLAYSSFDYARNVFAYAVSGADVVSLADGDQLTFGTEVIEGVAPSPDGEWIAFDSNRDGYQHIFKQRLDGSDRAQLTHQPRDDFVGGWSPDGTEIVFTTGTPSLELEVRVMAANGSRDAALFAGGWPFWSPTGLQMGFSDPEAGFELELMITSRDSVGGEWSEPVRIADGCSSAKWSPRGDRIVCRGRERGLRLLSDAGDVIWTLRPEAGSGVPELRSPVFSPDGATIYAQGLFDRDESVVQGVWAMSAADSGPPVPRLVIENVDGSLWAFPVSLSVGPDGRLYLSVARYESDIWVMDLAW